MKEYKNSMNLPKTDFGMRANLPTKEPEILKKWEGIYEKLLDREKEFVLHDGPPYANGPIHLGTAFNKILKDMVIRYKRLQGYKTEYIPGWDCHGLPIELAVLKEHGRVDNFRQKCRRHAEKYISKHRDSFKRLGVVADWDNYYSTMSPSFNASELRVFAKLVEKNLVYKALKPVYWCTATETALADSEAVYKDHNSTSIYFTVKADEEAEKKLGVKDINFILWTTTPWTLPGNLAVSVNPDMDYVIAKKGSKHYVLAEELYDDAKERLDLGEIVKNVNGKELEYIKYRHPFIDREGIVILGTHVTSDSGTGCVHTAPGHGMEDYVVCSKYGIDPICPVNEKGFMTNEAYQLEGLFYEKANKKVLEILGDSLMLAEEITHSYPYSERGKVPIIFRATEQWFVSVNSGLKEKAIDAIKNVKFYPSVGKNRLTSTISNRPDWCISRQRTWGLPIPAFHCSESNETLLDADLIREIADVVEKRGSDVFYQEDPTFFTKDRKCLGNWIRESSTFDVWFDAGTTYSSVINNRVADLYLEGSDQHRGWFQSSLLTSVGAFDRAPYRAIMTHGFVVDGNGIKMSKSIGNVIAPQEIISKYGADILRLWSASIDYSADAKISDTILKQTVDNYRKIRNFFRFILGNINDIDSSAKLSDLKIDQMAIDRLNSLIVSADRSFEEYSFHTALTEALNFITEMSSFYFDIIKDRLYCNSANDKDRRSAQYVLREIGTKLAKILSPILSFTTEEVWSYFGKESIMLELWPKAKSEDITKWKNLLEVRSEVNSKIEALISSGEVNSTTEVSLVLSANLDFFESDLVEIFKVSEVKYTKSDKLSISVSKSSNKKCERCWLYFKKLDNGLCSRCSKIDL